MIFQGCIAQVNASNNGSQTFQICSMAFNTNTQDQFVTIAHDGMIRIWDWESMGLKNSIRIKSGYLTSLLAFQDGFLVGTGNGQLIKYRKDFERDWIRKVHVDCLNDILETEKHLISVGSDGKICFLNKKFLQIEKSIETTVPLSKISRFGDQIYVSGNPSFIVNLNTFILKEQKRSFQFMQLQGEIIGCSDEQGLFVLGNSDHFDYINCHFMLKLNQRIITVSEETIGLISLSDQNESGLEVRYQLYKAPNLKKGYTIKTGLVNGNQIILAGQEGYIYKFKFYSSDTKIPTPLTS